MILDVFRCSQLFSDVFSWTATFIHNHPLCRHFSQDDVRCPRDVFRYSRDVFECSQLFSYVLRMPSIEEFDDPQLFDDPSYSMIPSFFYDPQVFDD